MKALTGFVGLAAAEAVTVDGETTEKLVISFVTIVVFPWIADAIKSWFKKRKERRQLGLLKDYMTGGEGR